jgi:hypothetical protein
VEAEIKGIPAALFTAIVDSHYVTSETLQAYSHVINQLLEITDVDFEKIARFPQFKAVLLEENARNHNIFN